MLVEVEFVCGYCGERSTLTVDPTGGASQSYVEDCPVCCRPNQVQLSVDPETGSVDANNRYEG